MKSSNVSLTFILYFYNRFSFLCCVLLTIICCCSFFFHCLSFFELRLLIIPYTSFNLSCHFTGRVMRGIVMTLSTSWSVINISHFSILLWNHLNLIVPASERMFKRVTVQRLICCASGSHFTVTGHFYPHLFTIAPPNKCESPIQSGRTLHL